MTAYDVVVAGGGPAGACTALVLARAGRRVLLADAGARGAYGVGESLPAAAGQVLRDLGLWAAFQAEPHLTSYGTRSAWGSDVVTQRHAVFDPYGHGWLLDRPRFDAFLRAAAAEAGATVVTEVVRDADAPWVVDATGRSAAVARGRGARRVEDDHLVAVVARYAAPDDVDATTLVEAVPGGWWYTARVPGRARVVAYLTDTDLLPPLLHGAAAFTAAMPGHVAAALTGGPLGAPRVVSARGGRLAAFAGDGWLATGDAALSFDPLASQGILTALVGGVAAGEALVATLDGEPGAVASYAARLTAVRAAYERNRLAYYALEHRWPHEPFWARRAGATRPEPDRAGTLRR